MWERKRITFFNCDYPECDVTMTIEHNDIRETARLARASGWSMNFAGKQSRPDSEVVRDYGNSCFCPTHRRGPRFQQTTKKAIADEINKLATEIVADGKPCVLVKANWNRDRLDGVYERVKSIHETINKARHTLSDETRTKLYEKASSMWSDLTESV